MNEGLRNQLDAQLKKMLDQAKAKKKKPKTPSGTGNIIRRRAGEKEKRFLSTYNSDCV
jgi:protoporphyrinogen oxidase